MGLRAFKATFLCAIDEDELDETPEKPLTVRDVKDYLAKALIVSFNDEEHGNPVGLQSVEVLTSELQELSPSELAQRYNR